MDPINVGSIIVAVIAAAAAYASQRAAARASTLNTTATSRVEMEKDAYNRARAFDTETIRRQDEEISELRVLVRRLRARLARYEPEYFDPEEDKKS
jgi:hypothetical protein